MIKYKLTSQDNKTYGNTIWGENVTYETSGEDELCGPGWLHYYDSPEMAVLMNPIHADIRNPKLWECEAEGKHKDDYGLKGGCTKLTTIREIELPKFSTEQRVKFAILCAKKVCHDPKWNEWADNWLSGKNRTCVAARAAGNAAYAAADAAYVAAKAAYVAAKATYAAAYATDAAANAAAYAADDVGNAAYAAAYAAANAAVYAAVNGINFQEIIEQL